MTAVERKTWEDASRFLISEGLLSAEAVERAHAMERDAGQPYATLLVRLGLISDEKLADGLSRFLKISRVKREDVPATPVLNGVLSAPFLKARHVLPLADDGRVITIAMADPLDEEAKAALAFALERPVRVAVAPLNLLEDTIGRVYFPETVAAPAGPEGMGADRERLQDLATDAPVIRFVERTIGEAMDGRASDIHFEAMEDRFRLRFRIDGMLVDRAPPPRAWQAATISRLKILGGLNIAEKRLPQDGRFKVTVRGSEVDFRVATMPSVFGESVVLRLLDRGKLPGDFASLGFATAATEPFTRALARPDGIVLVTGPTGSGKTTTLYSALKLLNSPERKILTVEDPVEYLLDGVNQVQVDPKIGRTFAATLRAFLRQDPDILLVGEIRDDETAEIAIQAALTGHLVLSTLHTNNAAAALTRLLDMGIEPFLIASTVRAVVAQRLVRLLCATCKVPQALPAAVRRRFGLLPKSGTFFQPVGCEACAGTGYTGRSGIIEALEVTDAIRDLIAAKADATAIEAAARRAGMVPMFDDGLKRAAAGLTPLDEILRVTREASK